MEAKTKIGSIREPMGYTRVGFQINGFMYVLSVKDTSKKKRKKKRGTNSETILNAMAKSEKQSLISNVIKAIYFLGS